MRRLDIEAQARMLRELSQRGALHALEEIRQWYPDAFIAGGCLRDLLHGAEPKDIDVFTFEAAVLRPGVRGLREMVKSGDAVFEPEDAKLVDAYDQARVVEVEPMIENWVVGAPVQIIHLRRKGEEFAMGDLGASTMLEAIQQFHLGICQIMLRNDGKSFMTTPAFTFDCRDECLTVRYCDSGEEAARIKRKAAALRERAEYRSHRLIISNNFKHLFEEF